MMRVSALTVVAVLVGACSTPGTGLDGGTDAGALKDSGVVPDAGATGDAGALDSGSDGGVALDGGDAGGGDAGIAPFNCNGASGAVFVSEVAPPATLQPYAVVQAAVTFANCTGQTWSAVPVGAATGYKLGFDAPRDYDTWGEGRIALPADVASGYQVTVPVRVRATPLTGPHDYRWSIVDEGAAWLAGPSPLHTIDVEAVSSTAAICPGVQADIGGGSSASAQIQQCIDNTPSGGTLELPSGVYRITSELQFNKPLSFRTANTAGVQAGCLDANGPPCAVLRADDNLNVPSGFVRLGTTTAVALDHLVLDGNRLKRLASAAAAQCAGGNNGPGFNAATGACTGCSFQWGVSARALCGTGWQWNGDQSTIADSVFRENGDHTTQNMWSDGLTLNQAAGVTVINNRMVDNSDVDLIFGGGPNSTIHGNVVEQLAQASFAGLMLDNFNGVTSGDFTGTMVTGNVVLCGSQQCDFAIELGPHPWYLSPNLIGGTVSGNTALGGKFNINAEGAGTLAAPMVVTGNVISSGPASANFNCGARASTAFNVSPDSHVDLQTGPQPTGSIQFHVCP